MAKKTPDNSQLLLVKDKEELKTEVSNYIAEGEKLAAKVVTTADEKDTLKAEFKRWDNRNYEAISRAFNALYHKHQFSYQYHEPIYVDRLVPGSRPRPDDLADQISEVKQAINSQLEKLRHFYDAIDVQQVAPGVIPKATPAGPSDLKILLRLLSRFHRFARAFRDRHGDREPVMVNDEYDVQYLLFALLQNVFDDVRKEDPSPNHSGAGSRIDFVLKVSDIVIEAKMTRSGLTDKKLGEELAVDILRYRGHPNAKHLVIFIYDPGDYILNKLGLIRDLSKASTPDFSIDVIINPE